MARPLTRDGVMLAFASGTLIAPLAFELFPEAVDVGRLGPSVTGLFTGAAVFVMANTILDSRVAAGAGDPDSVPAPAPVADAVAGAEAGQRDKLSTAASKDNVPAGVTFGLLAAAIPELVRRGPTRRDRSALLTVVRSSQTSAAQPRSGGG